MNKEIRIAGLVVAILLVTLCYLLNEAVDALKVNNNIENLEEDDLLRQEYERVLLGCSTAGAISSQDGLLRDLCDNTLPELRLKLDEQERERVIVG